MEVEIKLAEPEPGMESFTDLCLVCGVTMNLPAATPATIMFVNGEGVGAVCDECAAHPTNIPDAMRCRAHFMQKRANELVYWATLPIQCCVPA